MANNKFNKYIGAVALGVVITAVPSCKDDLSDFRGDGTSSPVATESLWELINSNPNLSKFASIAQKAKYWKDEKHPVKTYTYADILKSGQLATVWAPENDAISDEDYNSMLERCETDGYNLQQQFISNHIALWRRNVSTSGIDTIKMINGKNMIFDKSDTANCFIQGIPVDKKNIPAVNGTLHTIKGTTPFLYNFYEYLKFSSANPLISKYVVSNDTTQFYKDESIEGLPDENGNPTYVDSVYRTTNILFDSYNYLPKSDAEKWDMPKKCFHARINQEDSAFIMIIPTDEAWQKAKQKLAPFYKYPQQYEDKVKGDVALKASEVPIRKIGEKDSKEIDSLMNMSIEMDLAAPLVFNINKQPKVNGKLWTLEDFINNKGATAEYLLNTFGDTLRNITGPNYTWDKTSIFNGNLIKMSNGYAYEVTDWAFPLALYKPDIEVEIDGGKFYQTGMQSAFKVGTDTRTISFNNSTYADIANKYGHVSRNNYYYLSPSGPTVNPHAEIKLRGNLPSTSPVVGASRADVMSGKYDIYVVMVPEWYNTISAKGEISQDFYEYDEETESYVIDEETGRPKINQHYIDSLANISKMCFNCYVRYSKDGKKETKSSTSATITFDGSKVDTLLVFEDFEFPYSYKNLTYSYPVLAIDGKTGGKGYKTTDGFIYGLHIDRVILRSKETGEETILDPQ